MLSKPLGIRKTDVNFLSMMDVNANAIFTRLNCHGIGKILEFDASTQTCTIQLMQLKEFDDIHYIPAPLTQVPLIISGVNDAYITMPNPVGTTCLILFMDRNIDAFLRTKEQYAPETTRMHDFTDCVAITTFKTLVDPIENYDTEAITISYNKIIDEILYNAVIKNNGNSINMQVITEENTSQIQIDDKINIQNTAQNLALLIQNFLTACENITTVNGGALTPTSIQAFTDLKTQFEELLK